MSKVDGQIQNKEEIKKWKLKIKSGKNHINPQKNEEED